MRRKGRRPHVKAGRVKRPAIAGALAVLMLFLPGMVRAFPPYIPVATRFKESHVVIHARIAAVATVRHAGKNQIVRLSVQVLEVLKGKLKRKSLGLTFLAFPGSVESHLLAPLKKGDYVLFLQRKKVVDSRGRVGYALVFYEPRVYAYIEASAKILSRVQALSTKRRGP